MGRVDRVVGAISATSAVLSALCGGAIMLIMALDVSNRAREGRSLQGAFEMVEILVVLMVFLGIAYAERDDSHVRMRLMTSRMSPVHAEVVRLIGTLATLGLVLLFTFATTNRALASWRAGEFRSGLIQVPIWPARIIIAVGFSLLAVELLLRLVKGVRRLVHRREAPRTA